MVRPRNVAKRAHRGFLNIAAFGHDLILDPQRSAASYWGKSRTPGWEQNSHWRDAEVPGWEAVWTQIGVDHRVMYERFARALELQEPTVVLEWGVGGGSNAVAFAPMCEEFVAVDIAQESLNETARQVTAGCSTPVTPILVSIGDQSGPVNHLAAAVDLFICFYVLELLPSSEHAHEIVRIARHVVRPGGALIIQTKYRTSAPPRRPWQPAGSRLANQYIIDVPTFWSFLDANGFDVKYLELVPRNELDSNYAYYFATRR